MSARGARRFGRPFAFASPASGRRAPSTGSSSGGSVLLAWWCPRERVSMLGGMSTLVPRHHLSFNQDWDSPGGPRRMAV